ncbi:NAD(P)-binding protein [Clathrospora elynae]|uniref:NAD(P)-binding protein n=1 Tax=Clathrospora elynae TaxID=706981 RepID=A0A6A5T104_9PLEO|nr:NAD(P)-binding protein [Clathrospora elynae]
MPRMRILLTGADSLTGSHILGLLLSDNDLVVRAAVGTREAAYAIRQQYRQGTSSTVDLEVVPEKDLAVPGIFNNALTGDSFDTVVHTLTANPSEQADCLARFINLVSESIINFLRSTQQFAKQVRRVVLITSLTPFARWLQIERNSTVVDSEYILAASQAGDNIVHDAVSKWLRNSGAHFDVVYITAPSCYGPTTRTLETSSDLLEANRRIWNICSNEHRERARTPPYGIAHFVDARDLALASLRTIFTPRAGNQRFLVSAGLMPSSSDIAEFLVANFPELRGRVSMNGSPQDSTVPELSSLEPLDTSLAGAILGITRYRSAEETIIDTARQILDLQQRKEWKRIIQS